MLALERGLQVLEYLALKRQPVTFTEINTDLGTINRASLSSLLKRLIELGYVEKDDQTGRYSCGSRLSLFLNMKEKRRSDQLLGTYKNLMKELSQQYDVTTILFEQVKECLSVIYKDKTEASITMQPIGQTSLISIDSLWGQVILANDSMLTEAHQLTASQQELLASIKQQGYADDFCSYNPKIRRLAFPLRNIQGQTIGCLGIGATILSLNDENLNQFVTDTKAKLQCVK